MLKCYETCDILGLKLRELVLSKYHFKEEKKILKKGNLGFIYESHLKVSKKIYIISHVNTEINNGTYWISNLKVKWCSEDRHIQETKLNKLLPLTYIFEYYIQGSYWNKNLQFKFRCQQF